METTTRSHTVAYGTLGNGTGAKANQEKQYNYNGREATRPKGWKVNPGPLPQQLKAEV